MNEKACIYAIFFAVMIFSSKWFNKWILDKVYASANLTIKDVMEYRATLRGSTKQSRKLTSRILSVSPEPQKTKKYFAFYHLVSAPSVICFSISIMGLFTHFFDTFLDYAWFIVMLITFITTIYGSLINKK